MDAKEYLSTKEVTELTGLSRRVIAHRVKAGLLTPHRSFTDARLKLYRREEVEALRTINPV